MGGFHWGYNPLILTIDPNFLVHPSIWGGPPKEVSKNFAAQSFWNLINTIVTDRHGKPDFFEGKNLVPENNGVCENVLIWFFFCRLSNEKRVPSCLRLI